jgi:hypothetical protein
MQNIYKVVILITNSFPLRRQEHLIDHVCIQEVEPPEK